MIQLVPLDATRTLSTPAATMRTYASPSTDTAAAVSVWRTELAAGSSGPTHVVDTDHVVVVVEGTLLVDVDGVRGELGPGDGVVLPAGTPRTLSAGPAADVVTVTSALPGSQARVGEAEPVAVPWAS